MRDSEDGAQSSARREGGGEEGRRKGREGKSIEEMRSGGKGRGEERTGKERVHSEQKFVNLSLQTFSL